MVGQILDQIQKLFGRAFLIAYFIPNLLFVFTVYYLCFGDEELIKIIQDWANADWKQSITQLLLFLTVIYLLAYVLFGVRFFLLQIYQGEWHILPLRLLRSRAIKWQNESMKKYEAAVEEHLEALNDIYWASKWDFGDSYTPVVLDLVGAKNQLEEAKSLKQKLIEKIKSQEEIKKKNLAKLLRLSRELHANRNSLQELEKTVGENLKLTTGIENIEKIKSQEGILKRNLAKLLRLSKFLRLSRKLHANRKSIQELEIPVKEKQELTTEIENLVEGIKSDYQQFPKLQTAVEALEVRRLREWDTAKDYYNKRFPDNERWLRPTRLGNIVVVQEIYPLDRYGISLSVLWPRLFNVIPENVRQRIEDASIYVDFTITLSFLAFIASLVSFVNGSINVVLLYWRQPIISFEYFEWRLIYPLFLIILGFICYRASIQATLALGVQIQAAIDLFRLKLLDALDIERPKEIEKEIKIWEALLKFFATAEVPENDIIKLKIPDEKPPDKDTKLKS